VNDDDDDGDDDDVDENKPVIIQFCRYRNKKNEFLSCLTATKMGPMGRVK